MGDNQVIAKTGIVTTNDLNGRAWVYFQNVSILLTCPYCEYKFEALTTCDTRYPSDYDLVIDYENYLQSFDSGSGKCKCTRCDKTFTVDVKAKYVAEISYKESSNKTE